MNEIYSVIKRDTLIFLKSNYKYKRREVQLEPEPQQESEKHICRRTFNKKFNINICIFKNILRLFILIIKNYMQQSRVESHLLHPKDGPVVSVATVYAEDKCIKANHLSAADKVNYVENYDELSTVARCRKVSLYQCHWPTMKYWRRKLVYGVSNHYNLLTALPSFTSTPSTTKLSMKHLPVLVCGKRISALSILMTVFIAFALIARSVEAGTCWETSFKHFKCDKIFAMNISKAECCGYSQEFSYTDRELTGVEFFFATTIGEGAECAPCMETCKAIKCGENKKCVKRKGRPKCICAPECGQSACRRNRFRAQRKHNIYNEPFHIGYDKRRISAVTHVELNKSPRDIRSLSSENMNINLGLDDVLHQNHNQRKIHIMQSQPSQQKPQYKQKESVHGRILITANTEPQQVHQEQHEQPGPRRLQILSNVGIYEDEEQKVRRRNKNDYYRNRHDNNESKTKIKYKQDHNNHHRRNKNTRVRHIQENSDNVNLPNHNNEKLDKYHQQYQHKHQHQQHQQQQQQQQQHNRKKHKKLRDHLNPTYTSTPLLSSTSNDELTTSAATSTVSNATATTATTTTKTTPVYALSSPWLPSAAAAAAAGTVNHQRLLNRGNFVKLLDDGGSNENNPFTRLNDREIFYICTTTDFGQTSRISSLSALRPRLKSLYQRFTMTKDGHLALSPNVEVSPNVDINSGTCWETSFKHFKCDKIFAMNISKAECCGYSQEFSYTDRELTGVEFFFATTIGEGAECAPCMETCKAIKCGENKKCVKRKGRPKCICAPECGQSACRRNRFRAQRKHNIYNEPFHIGYDKRRISAVTHVELNKSPRDIRSLSSENMNINLGLDDVLHQNHNQRKIHIMQSQPSQQKPQYKQKESVHGRILITANTEPQQVHQEQHEQPGPRRLQILSNVGIYEDEEQKVRRRNKNDYYRNRHDNNESKTKIKYKQDHNNHHRRNKNTRVRHIQENSDNVNLPNHNNEKLDKYHQQYQHKHQHQQHQQQQQQQQQHNRKKHKKLRDHLNPTYTSTPLLSSTSNDELTTSAATSTVSNATATTATTTTKTTPVYALSSPWLPSAAAAAAAGTVNHQRLLNRGSNSATSLSVQHFDNMHNTNPVCGTDGRTYKTECQLKKRACRTDNPDLKVAYCGRCKTTCNGIKCLNGLTCVEDQYTIPHCITCKIDCPQDDATDIIDPIQAVCGVDGKTYKSTCDINRMICKTGKSIAVAYPGPCRDTLVYSGNVKRKSVGFGIVEEIQIVITWFGSGKETAF
ncbi:uncharacterized protein LOC119674784 [Teleopsis dalmanni]|uniref:uncharacterized protein LOC119674784 n=1 Tax=Teleopsis dalmanni TaxID=139649 RepID=UPI0018CD881D|nr:uncharacterized protein LOC119674784 [Teleopsis dalmanni]